MKKLPDTIIIRRDDKYHSELKYKLCKWHNDSQSFKWCYFDEISDKKLMYANTVAEILAAIKIFCELWIDKDKIFFEYDNGKKNMKPFLDAAGMLKEMSK